MRSGPDRRSAGGPIDQMDGLDLGFGRHQSNRPHSPVSHNLAVLFDGETACVLPLRMMREILPMDDFRMKGVNSRIRQERLHQELDKNRLFGCLDRRKFEGHLWSLAISVRRVAPDRL